MTADPSSPGFSKDHPFLARLTERRRLSKPGSEKDTQHFVVDISGSGLTYKCGDSLGVFPTNDPAGVDAVLQALKLAGSEPVLPPKETQPIALREALLHRFSLSQPTKKVLQTLHDLTAAPDEKAHLHNLLSATKPEELHAYLDSASSLTCWWNTPARRSPRSCLWTSCASSNPGFIPLPPRPRSTRTKSTSPWPSCATRRTTVRASAWPPRIFPTARRCTSPWCPSLSRTRTSACPKTTRRDIIMVGPGTGIAPFRAFAQERIKHKAAGRMWVFFGDQRRAFDYLYEEEWEAWRADGKLTRLDLAFSRDQAHKIYVQDRMQESAAELWAWLQAGAAFYVCGDAKRMAKDVDLALHDIIATQGQMDAPKAAEYVKLMKKEKRYQRDVY